MDRQERRERKERKWISRLKKYWHGGVLWERVLPVKSNSPRNDELKLVESINDLKKDKFAVKIKNTGTICVDNKFLTKKDEHKRNVANRTLSKEDKEELDKAVELMDNPWSFEDYCDACDLFGTDDCPFRDKVNGETRWKEIGCTEFWD